MSKKRLGFEIATKNDPTKDRTGCGNTGTLVTGTTSTCNTVLTVAQRTVLAYTMRTTVAKFHCLSVH